MRRMVLAVVAASLLGVVGSPALAQDQQGQAAQPGQSGAPGAGAAPAVAGLLETLSTCLGYAGQSALPLLGEAQNYTPTGYGPYGWAPLTQPWGAGPIGPLTAYSPPGVVPAYGPLGPGLTANAIAAFAVPPGGFGFNNPNLNNYANVSTLTSLAALQQGEQGTLYGRYGLAPAYQLASGTWRAAYSTQAASTFAVALALCVHRPPAASGATTSMIPWPGAPGAMMGPSQP
jgi:hypothetical protein